MHAYSDQVEALKLADCDHDSRTSLDKLKPVEYECSSRPESLLRVRGYGYPAQNAHITATAVCVTLCFVRRALLMILDCQSDESDKMIRRVTITDCATHLTSTDSWSHTAKMWPQWRELWKGLRWKWGILCSYSVWGEI